MASRKDNMKIIREWLKKGDWKFEESREDGGNYMVQTGLASDSGVYRGYDIKLVVREDDVQSLFYPPVRATDKTMPCVMEYLMRVNHRVRLGKFTIDLDDGEIRYEYVVGAPLIRMDPDEYVSDLMALPSYVLERYISGLAAVTLGVKTPEQAFKDCDLENPVTSDEEGGEARDPVGSDFRSEKDKKCRGRKGRGRNPSGKKTASTATKVSPAKDYALEGLNILGDVPLEKIVAAVRRFRAGKHSESAPRLNILLSGVPGSGKTAFANYLAQAVGAPIHTVRANELLRSRVGETERLLAEVFDTAREKGEILFLDEIDSFLQNRQNATQAWEVTQVNELLQQLESFNGVVLGATNFAERLDPAVLRRFTYKLKLDYLTDEGKEIFFDRYFKAPLSDEERTCLHAIDRLTPGDFRTVRESLHYLSDAIPSNAERLKALQAESDAKGLAPHRMGFQ